MDVTTVEHPEGTGETFSCTDMVAGLTFSRMLTDRFSAGLTVKYVREQWDDVSAGGIAVDMGTLYDTGFKTLRIGMAIQHFGGELTPDGERAGTFDEASWEWVELPEKYHRDIYEAMDMAARIRPVEMTELPLGRISR